VESAAGGTAEQRVAALISRQVASQQPLVGNLRACRAIAREREGGLERGVMDQPAELGRLFHRLNNQLGIILAHAELMEKKAPDDVTRSRATQVVSSVLNAMGTAKEIRMQLGTRASDA
jgi:hypothetical protein